MWALPGVEVVRKPIDTPSTLRRLLLEDNRYDLAFNLCESLRGDPRFEIPVPVILEAHGIPYTGNPPFALRRCLDKLSAREALAAEGVPIPAGCGVRREEDLFRLDGPLPAIVKPVREDGSIGIESGSVVRDRASLRRRARYVLEKLKQPALVEAYVEGREFNVSVLGDLEPASLPVAEIDFSRMPVDVPRIVSYSAKWRTRSAEFKGTVPTFGALDEGLARRVRRAALGAFRALGLRDYARIDLRVDAAGRVFVIDVNPNCDLAPDAGYPKAAAAAGLTYVKLVHAIVALALERGRRHARATARPL